MSSRLRYFASVTTPVACFDAGHRTPHKADLQQLNVEYRRLMRSVVGPPSDVSWDNPWHETLHAWNAACNKFLKGMASQIGGTFHLRLICDVELGDGGLSVPAYVKLWWDMALVVEVFGEHNKQKHTL